jgi:hypothetical protein
VKSPRPRGSSLALGTIMQFDLYSRLAACSCPRYFTYTHNPGTLGMACHAPSPVGGTLQSSLRASHHRVPKLIGSSLPIASIDDHALFKRVMLFFACLAA